MFTPSSYSHKMLGPIIEDFKNRGGRFFHQTKLLNLSEILRFDRQALFSIATLWGKDKNLRTSLNPRFVSVSADAGLMDYVFLCNINRLTHHTVSKSVKSHLYGQLVIEVDPEILLRRDFFVFPFNVGYQWLKANTLLEHKLSDLSTLRICLDEKLAGNEFLVRRKVPVESFRGFYFPKEHENYVQAELDKLNAERLRNHKPALDEIKLNPIKGFANTLAFPENSMDRPNFDIEIHINGSVEIVQASELHFTHKNRNDLVFFIDKDSGCIREYAVDGMQLCNAFDRRVKCGKIVPQAIIKKAA